MDPLNIDIKSENLGAPETEENLEVVSATYEINMENCASSNIKDEINEGIVCESILNVNQIINSKCNSIMEYKDDLNEELEQPVVNETCLDDSLIVEPIQACDDFSYSCDQCSFKATFEEVLIDHINSVHFGSMPLIHLESKLDLNQKQDLGSIHPMLKPFELDFERGCIIPGEVGLEPVVLNPVLHRKSNKSYECSECSFKTSRKRSLRIHVDSVHLKLKSFKCSECNFATSHNGNLKKHIDSRHLRSECFQCSSCEYRTFRKGDLKIHNDSVHLRLNTFGCTICDFKTSQKSRLKYHVDSVHLKIKELACFDCNYRTNFKSQLEKHRNSVHLKLKSFECIACDFKTSEKCNLKIHINAVHSKAKCYECTICDYKTFRSNQLKMHVDSNHLKLRSFECTECDFKTFQKCRLKHHRNSVHLRIRNLECSQCDFKTNYKCYLDIHVNTVHLKLKNFECSECDYKTGQKSTLKTHINSKHLNLKEFQCTDCNFKTSVRRTLKNHIDAIHLKLKPFACTECEFKTALKVSLRNHINSFHKLNKSRKNPHKRLNGAEVNSVEPTPLILIKVESLSEDALDEKPLELVSTSGETSNQLEKAQVLPLPHVEQLEANTPSSTVYPLVNREYVEQDHPSEERTTAERVHSGDEREPQTEALTTNINTMVTFEPKNLALSECNHELSNEGKFQQHFLNFVKTEDNTEIS